jgi:acetolactate synthase-1/2/3 large subunit
LDVSLSIKGTLRVCTGIPVAGTFMFLGSFPYSHEKILGMLGMHGTVYANYTVDKVDPFLDFGVFFNDGVTNV